MSFSHLSRLLFFILCSSIYFIIALKSTKNENEDNKLLFVWEHFRHGARGPYVSVDPVTNLDFIGETWSGLGEITPLGMRMLYLLGVSMKKRYSDFLSKNFNPNEIFIESTIVNRTILSCYSYLQGMYNNTTSIKLTANQILNAKIKNENYSNEINEKISNLNDDAIENGINIFPLHNFDSSKHEFGLYDVKSCPGIKTYKDQNQHSTEIINIYENISKTTNDTFGKYIFDFMNISGIENPKYLWNKTNIYYIGDNFISDYFDGREMSKIRKTGINMENFYDTSINIAFTDTYYWEFGIPATKTVYVTVSPIMSNLLNYMKMRINLDKNGKSDKIIASSPKFVIISGHDTSLAPVDIFMYSVFNVNYEPATYAASQIFELWKNGTKYYVNYVVNQEIKATFDFEEFYKKVKEKIYNKDEVNHICFGGEKSEMNSYKTIFTVFIVTIVILILVLVIMIIQHMIIKNKRNEF